MGFVHPERFSGHPHRTAGRTVMGDDTDIIDSRRAVGLGDVGAPDYLAATVISADGSTELVLARRDALGDVTARYQSGCPDAIHEQLGELPLEYIRRITISQRTQRKPK